MHSKIESISPEIARKYLEKNIERNRTLQENHVALLAREMSEGRWKTNGQAIIFSKDGHLIDGQHRLAAIIKSGCTIDIFVVRGVESSAFDTIDTGKKRKPSDALSILGEKNCTLLAASLIVVDRYSTGGMFRHERYSPGKVEELLGEHPGIRRSVELAGRSKLIPGSVLAGCHYFFTKRDQAAADRFVHDLMKGANLDDSDPVYVLRERLMKNQSLRQKLSAEFMMAITIKAWNARRANRSIKLLHFTETGDNRDEFPMIQ